LGCEAEALAVDDVFGSCGVDDGAVGLVSLYQRDVIVHNGGVRTLHAWASGLYRNLVGLRRRSRVWRGRRDGHHPNERGLNVARLMPKVSGDHSEGHGVWIAREDYTSLEICYRDSSVG